MVETTQVSWRVSVLAWSSGCSGFFGSATATVRFRRNQASIGSARTTMKLGNNGGFVIIGYDNNGVYCHVYRSGALTMSCAVNGGSNAGARGFDISDSSVVLFRYDTASGTTSRRWSSLERPRLERPRQTLQLPTTHDDHVKANGVAAEFTPAVEPRFGGEPDPADLLLRDHLDWVAESWPRLRFHLAEGERAAAPHDEIELITHDPAVRVDDAPAAAPVPPRGTPLGVVPRLRPRRARRRTQRGNTKPERNGGGSRSARSAGPRRCAKA